MKYRKSVTRRWTARALATAILAVGGAAAITLPAFAATPTQILANQTFPRGGVVLTGADGQQHLWTPDHLTGVCRVDKNADGSYAMDGNSCLLAFGGSPAIKAGQLAYDGRYLYMPDLSSKSIGVGMVGYAPAANGGRGGLSVLDRKVLAANCGLGGDLPWGRRSARTTTCTCRSRTTATSPRSRTRVVLRQLRRRAEHRPVR